MPRMTGRTARRPAQSRHIGHLCAKPQPSLAAVLCHGMPVIAVRTFEPWTPLSIAAGIVLLILLVYLLILALGRDNRYTEVASEPAFRCATCGFRSGKWMGFCP